MGIVLAIYALVGFAAGVLVGSPAMLWLMKKFPPVPWGIFVPVLLVVGGAVVRHGVQLFQVPPGPGEEYGPIDVGSFVVGLGPGTGLLAASLTAIVYRMLRPARS